MSIFKDLVKIGNLSISFKLDTLSRYSFPIINYFMQQSTFLFLKLNHSVFFENYDSSSFINSLTWISTIKSGGKNRSWFLFIGVCHVSDRLYARYFIYIIIFNPLKRRKPFERQVLLSPFYSLNNLLKITTDRKQQKLAKSN